MILVYTAIPVFDVPPYIEGTEPVPSDFHLIGTFPPVYIKGFNFTNETVPFGQSVYLVLDMFQRYVVSRPEAEAVVTQARKGIVIEGIVSTPYRNYFPNFAQTDQDGKLLDRKTAVKNPFAIYAESSGTVRLHDKKYAPIQQTWAGGEDYVNDAGERDYRKRGSLRYDKDGLAIYLLGRKLIHDRRWFAIHEDRRIKDMPDYTVDQYSDSPLIYEYLNGKPCNSTIKPIPINDVFPEEWETTQEWRDAQLNHDIALAPDAADGEVFVKGEELCFRRKIVLFNVPALDEHGKPITETVVENGKEVQNPTYIEVIYTYYEVIPPDEYREPLRGQADTEAFIFQELENEIKPSDIDHISEDDIVEYVRLWLNKSTGVPKIHDETKVCRLCEFAPSRGIFIKHDEDGIRYPILCTPDTSDGYGISTATIFHGYDAAHSVCEDVVEHKSHRLVRRNHELLIFAEECWKNCANIVGTIPPDLGDPRQKPKRIIFVKEHGVEGNVPPLSELMRGAWINLITGVITEYAKYRYGVQPYPDKPTTETWNPGGLRKQGCDFIGFSNLFNASEPVYWLSADTDIKTLHPVWRIPNVVTEFVTLTFCGCNYPTDQGWRIGNHSVQFIVPKGTVMDTSKYDPLEIPEVNIETGYFFAGWKKCVANITTVVCDKSMTLRPASSETPVIDVGDFWCFFNGEGDVKPIAFRVPAGTIVNLTLYPAFAKGKVFIGWSRGINSPVITSDVVDHDVTYYANFVPESASLSFTVTFMNTAPYGSAFYGRVPPPITVRHGSEIDLLGYGDDIMLAYGYYFAGWSTEFENQIVLPRISVIGDTVLYPVWYSADFPVDKPPKCKLSFGGDYEIAVNFGSCIRLAYFNPKGVQRIGYIMAGWNTAPNAAESLFHISLRKDTFLYPVWKQVPVTPEPGANPTCGCGDYVPDIGIIFDPNNPMNPYNTEENPYH